MEFKEDAEMKTENFQLIVYLLYVVNFIFSLFVHNIYTYYAYYLLNFILLM